MTDLIKTVAWAMCVSGGFDPTEIMPNDGPRWRYYVPLAESAIRAIEAAGYKIVQADEIIRLRSELATMTAKADKYEECLRVLGPHFHLPSCENGPCDDPRAWDRAAESCDDYLASLKRQLEKEQEEHRMVRAELAKHQWRTMDSAPKDGTQCLFFSPGRENAWHHRARNPRMTVDEISAEWPQAHYQLPEAPYTHWMPLPEPPK